MDTTGTKGGLAWGNELDEQESGGDKARAEEDHLHGGGGGGKERCVWRGPALTVAVERERMGHEARVSTDSSTQRI